MQATTTQLEQTLEAGLTHLHQQYDISIAVESQAMLLHYLTLLVKWNRVYNLTAIREPSAMVQRHLIDSLILCRWLPVAAQTDPDCADVVDIGSGAGLPCLPLAMARPDLVFVSVESNGKKTRFQQQVLVETGMKNVQIRNQRIQDIALQADFLTSRAFTAPADFLQIVAPLCRPQSRVALMLAQRDKLPEPLPAGFTLQEVVPVDIPGNCAPRHIAICRRTP